MAKNLNKLLIITEMHDVVRVRRKGAAQVRGFCPACEGQVVLLPFDAAAKVGGLTGRELIDSISSTAVHAVEAQGGPLLVCMTSLESVEEEHRTAATQQSTSTRSDAVVEY
jgi:hypothetical protein